MDEEQLCESLIKWLQTFELPVSLSSRCTTAEGLSDGVAMAHVLTQISPEHFDSSWMQKIKTDVSTNWRLKISNLRKILQGISFYYMEFLGQQIIDFRLPDVNAIGEHHNASDLGRLLQLILGCAVNCDHKEEYIQVIMGMEEAVQHVVMNAIKELMTIDRANIVHNDVYGDTSEQLRRMMDELQATASAKEQIGQRCHELDLQVTALQEEKANLMAENERLSDKLMQAESLDDLSSAAGRRNQTLQHQVDQLQEELYKFESSRDEYRSKVDELQLEVRDLQEKNEELQRVAEEARVLKDEVDFLRETGDKVKKYESTLETYKKRLEELGDVKRQLKLLEEQNTGYMQQKLELEEERKKTATLRTQMEMYRKQVQELHAKNKEETTKADRAEFERKKLYEKFVALEREKERLVAERDMLKETNDELKLTQLHIELTSSHNNAGHPSNVGADAEIFEMIPPEVKERLIRLQHENKMLRLNRQGSEEEQIQVLQTIVDDGKERQSELETENRLANQRILELESQLEEFHADRTAASNTEEDELRQKLNSSLVKVRELEQELSKRNSEIEQKENSLSEFGNKVQQLQEVVGGKDEEIREMEERYKKYLEKAKNVMKNMDAKPNLLTSTDVVTLQNQIHEKDKHIEDLVKESKQSKTMKENEEKRVLSAFHNLGIQLQRKASEERLANPPGLSFLARQRQSTSRRTGVGLGQSDFFDI